MDTVLISYCCHMIRSLALTMVSVICSSLLIILAAACMSANMIDHLMNDIDLKRLDVVTKSIITCVWYHLDSL